MMTFRSYCYISPMRPFRLPRLGVSKAAQVHGLAQFHDPFSVVIGGLVLASKRLPRLGVSRAAQIHSLAQFHNLFSVEAL